MEEPITGSVCQREGKEPNSDAVSGDPVELDRVTLRHEVAKVKVGVLRGSPTKLILLHKGYKSRPHLEVVCFDGRIDNG